MYPVNRLIEKKILSSINRLVHILIDMSCASEDRKGPYMQEAVELIRDIRPYLLSLIEGKEMLLESLLRQLISQKLPHPAVLRSFGDLQHDLNRIIHAALYHQTEETGDTTETGVSADDVQENAGDMPTGFEMSGAASADLTLPPPSDAAATTMESAADEADSGLPSTEQETDDQLPAESCAETATKTEEPAGVPVDECTKMPKLEEPSDLLQCIISSIYAGEVIIKDYIFKTLPLNYYLPERKTAIITADRRRSRMHELFLKKKDFDTANLSQKSKIKQNTPRYAAILGNIKGYF